MSLKEDLETLTEHDIELIRRLREEGMRPYIIAKKFEIAASTARAIIDCSVRVKGDTSRGNVATS